jgi:hypothetical protein
MDINDNAGVAVWVVDYQSYGQGSVRYAMTGDVLYGYMYVTVVYIVV